jgi:hypothetical protein
MVKDAVPATVIEIETYMAAIGFSKQNDKGKYSNAEYIVWDLLPRNVLKDKEGDVFVVDAEIKNNKKQPSEYTKTYRFRHLRQNNGRLLLGLKKTDYFFALSSALKSSSSILKKFLFNTRLIFISISVFIAGLWKI